MKALSNGLPKEWIDKTSNFVTGDWTLPLFMPRKKPSQLILWSILALSILIILSANNWLFLWVAIEINLLTFVPLLLRNKDRNQTEGSIKYFLPQAVGSALILIYAITSYSPRLLILPELPRLCLLVGLFIKIGMPPLHFWIPQVIERTSWTNCILLSTLQKVGPIAILILRLSHISYLTLTPILILSALLGSIGGLNQIKLRSMLAFSSMSHISWILLAALISPVISTIYFLCYILISLSIMLTIHQTKTKTYKSILSLRKTDNLIQWPTLLMLLSLGGLPPTFGFFPKWLVIENLARALIITTTILILRRALINLFFYLRLSFNFIANNQTHTQNVLTLPTTAITLVLTLLPSVPFIRFLIIYAMNLFNKP